jgi:polysaccharide export outer membrane protein
MSAPKGLILALTFLWNVLACGQGLSAEPAQGSKGSAGTPVTARIVTPTEGSSYRVGEIIALVADAGSGEAAQRMTFQWEVALMRDGREPVAQMTAAGRQTSFVATESSDDANLSYRVRLLAGGAQAPQDTLEVHLYPKSGVEPSRTIHAGDLLEVSFYAGGEKQEDFTAQVSSSGYLNAPLIGEIRVADFTPFKAADVMRSLLADRFYVNPQVLVSLKELGGKVYVSGEVSRPGAYGLQEGLTVLKVCALAGGFTNFAAQNAVKVTRNERGVLKSFKLDLARVRSGKQEDMILQNGDQIDVPHRRF